MVFQENRERGLLWMRFVKGINVPEIKVFCLVFIDVQNWGFPHMFLMTEHWLNEDIIKTEELMI